MHPPEQNGHTDLEIEKQWLTRKIREDADRCGLPDPTYTGVGPEPSLEEQVRHLRLLREHYKPGTSAVRKEQVPALSVGVVKAMQRKYGPDIIRFLR